MTVLETSRLSPFFRKEKTWCLKIQIFVGKKKTPFLVI